MIAKILFRVRLFFRSLFKIQAKGLLIVGKIRTEYLECLLSAQKAEGHVEKRIEANSLSVTKKVTIHYLPDPVLFPPPPDMPPSAFSLLIGLKESHIAIHSWPENFYATVEVHICNYSQDNSLLAQKMFEEILEFFSPCRTRRTYVFT